MFLSPAEIREVKLARGLRGYDREAARRLLEDVVASYEAVWHERDELRGAVERLEGELAQFRDLERLLRDTLVVAQRSAEEIKAHSRLEAETTIEEARATARKIVEEAETTSEHLRDEIRRLREEEGQIRRLFAELLRRALKRLEIDGERGGASERRSLLEDLVPAMSLARSGMATAPDELPPVESAPVEAEAGAPAPAPESARSEALDY